MTAAIYARKSTDQSGTVISVDASEHRAHAATKAGVLSAALDAAVSAGADTSLEKMIAHQVAAAHHAGMELLGRVADGGALGHHLPPVERARLTNAAAPLFEVSQAGCPDVAAHENRRHAKPSSCSTSTSSRAVRPSWRGVSRGSAAPGEGANVGDGTHAWRPEPRPTEERRARRGSHSGASVRGTHAAEHSVSGAGDAQRPTSDARGREHRAADPGGPRAVPVGAVDTWRQVAGGARAAQGQPPTLADPSGAPAVAIELVPSRRQKKATRLAAFSQPKNVHCVSSRPAHLARPARTAEQPFLSRWRAGRWAFGCASSSGQSSPPRWASGLRFGPSAGILLRRSRCA